VHDLSPLQRKLLEAFFETTQGFVLSGGAALVGFHLHHRQTRDLDLFTVERDQMDEGERALRNVVDRFGWKLEAIHSSPLFRRFLVSGQDDSVVVDLIFEPIPQRQGSVERFGAVTVASPREVLTGKLCALLSRGEIRDLVDVMLLERQGYPAQDVLEDAAERDTAFTPGQLAWVLSQIEIGADARIPGGVSKEELSRWLEGFIRGLTDLAYPDHSG